MNTVVTSLWKMNLNASIDVREGADALREEIDGNLWTSIGELLDFYHNLYVRYCHGSKCL